MPFLQKHLIFLCFLSLCNVQKATSQGRDGNIIPRDSLKKYWIEMLDQRSFLWMGGGIGLANSRQTRVSNEASFIPKKKNDVYTLQLRLSFSQRNAGFPTAYTREINTMYGKVYKGYRCMFIGSAGISGLWGRKWLDQIATITSPPAGGLRRNVVVGSFYNTERFWTIGIPLRAQAFLIAGKEMAFGITVGTNLNVKQIQGDAMFTFLLGIN